MAIPNMVSVAIYPPLGIARIGNSDEHYFSSDLPGKAPEAQGGYKDQQGRIKKQVARFRIYALDKDGKPIQEVTVDPYTAIEWRVNLANRKAGWYNFENALDLPPGQPITPVHRNLKAPERNQLNIVPSPQVITGIKQGPKSFDDGQFYGKKVPLGAIKTDEAGRLLVFGADGNSASFDGSKPYTFANNDGWHDDVADGTIHATVTIEGKAYPAKPAMVAITPPNYAQGLFPVVSMYDVVEDLFARNNWITPPSQVVFWDHIYPILEYTVQTQWVNHGFYMLFGQNSPSDFTAEAILKRLQDPNPDNKPHRQRVFQWYRSPDITQYEPVKIPPFYGDAFGEDHSVPPPNLDLPLTALQYSRMQQWAEGNFVTGTRNDKTFDQLTPLEQTKALEKAPLEECLGGPFHPGIEITWPFRNLIFWESAFRIKQLPENQEPADDYGPQLTPEIALGPQGPLNGSGPGSLTRWLGVPWQTDEASCLAGYDTSTYLVLPSFWAARVPNEILSADAFSRLADHTVNLPQRLKHLDYRQNWLRDLGSQYLNKINNMVHNWHHLGIATEVTLQEESRNPALPVRLWVETGRGGFTSTDASFEQVKIAEFASAPLLQRTQEQLAAISGVLASKEKLRIRKPFRRDEM
ncbi:LodA/GoxA family CTQ-dependent oxidase [Chitinophaga sp. HK235]|uniref:LodA/GoxA family CTQ-dependent oxidase n=1 Tax=Chitinophaga sp. HK235 TaxID=2952571 RepID=UPI001BA7E0A2|nr:LodA/GoxA family CTQ-dependent oxidase [Chitinophaga sp. HK235]